MKVLYLSASIPLIFANRADLFSVAATVPLNSWLYSAEEMSPKRIAQQDHKPQSPYRCPLERGGDCALRSGRTDRSDAIFLPGRAKCCRQVAATRKTPRDLDG